MTPAKLIVRSLQFHARTHAGAILGAAVGAAVLIGALLVGDSVRGSLRDMALARLGNVSSALTANDRFVTTQLSKTISESGKIPLVSVIQVPGTAASTDGSARANQVQVLGVEPSFWSLGSQPSFPHPNAEELIVNETLARQLGVKVGDTILLRVNKPSKFSREAPLSPQDDFALPLRLRITGIAANDQMGRFSLRANQIPPFNAFVDAAWLGERLEIPARANLILAAGGPEQSEIPLQTLLAANFQLADAELELRELPGESGFEVRTSRVFLDPATASSAMKAQTNATGVLTYFVNELGTGTNATPYSMVAALGPGLLPSPLKDDEILINQWLADDLKCQPGDPLTMTYYIISSARVLQERTNHFTIRGVLPMSGIAADRTLMPDFPGIDKAESTRDWDSSLPVQLERIRPQDEDYWKQHRGTPKAFITLEAGQQMWTNRFGGLTAVRYPNASSADALSSNIRKTLHPAALGLSFQPVRQQALTASAQAQDFGQLFLGFSFFLIVAALLLMALLYQFGIERRATEIGTLLALGFTPGLVRRLMLWEGIALALLGTLLGVPGGMLYAKAMLYGLSTIWRSAVGTSSLEYHSSLPSIIVGTISGVIVASITIWMALRKQARQPARELLAQGAETEKSLNPQRSSRGIWIGWLASAGAMLLIGWAGLREQTANPGVFFLAGTLLLISGMGFAAAVLAALGHSESPNVPGLSRLGIRNATRRRRRSLATVGLLACGSFLVAAIGVFKLDADGQSQKRTSGTGGFALIGESAFPIRHDLNTESGREFFGFSDADLAGVRLVSFRVRDGEDASCLNLNRAQQPKLLGVQPELLNDRKAFTFTGVAKGYEAENPWLLLSRPGPNDEIPAIGDAASIQWALGKKLGDVLMYTDESGREFKIRLVAAVANSILQGSLVIAETEFLTRFPSEEGFRMFLVDVSPYEQNRIEEVAQTLSRAAQDYGMQVTPAPHRLAAFNAVQNTYLNTFQVLGGLGLLLGSVGLGVVVLRNILERRSELALFLAVGFRIRALRWLVLSEHGALLLAGLVIGSVAAFVAVLPSLLAPGTDLPWRSLGLTLLAILLSGLVWTFAAGQLALRGRLLDSLRSE